MKFDKFICVAKDHASWYGGSEFTFHKGVWAFCSDGPSTRGHEGQTAKGLPITKAIRLPPHMPAMPSDPRQAHAAPTPISRSRRGQP